MSSHIDPNLTKELEDKQMAKLQQTIEESNKNPQKK
jgi:hypothetical protein